MFLKTGKGIFKMRKLRQKEVNIFKSKTYTVLLKMIIALIETVVCGPYPVTISFCTN